MFLIEVDTVFENAKSILQFDSYTHISNRISSIALEALKRLPYQLAFQQKSEKLRSTNGKLEKPSDFFRVINLRTNHCTLDHVKSKSKLTNRSFFEENCHIFIGGQHTRLNTDVILTYYSIPMNEETNKILINEEVETAVTYYIIKELALSKAFSPQTAQKYASMAKAYEQKFSIEADRLFGVSNLPSESEMNGIYDSAKSMDFRIRR